MPERSRAQRHGKTKPRIAPTERPPHQQSASIARSCLGYEGVLDFFGRRRGGRKRKHTHSLRDAERGTAEPRPSVGSN